MRVFIYSETANAYAKRDELRADDHHASLRNPQFFNPAQFDKTAEKVFADDDIIIKAYEGVGIAVEKLTPIVPVDFEIISESTPIEDTTPVLLPIAEEPEIEKPKRGRPPIVR